MEENTAVNDQLATDQVHSTQETSEVNEAQPNHNMRQLREAYEREKHEKSQAALELAQMKAKLEMFEQGYQKTAAIATPEPDYISELNSMDDDLPNGAQVKRVVGGLAGEIKRLQSQLHEAKSSQNNGALTPIERARLKFEDYTRVVNKEAIEKYLTNPALRELIDTSEPTKQPELAYRIIKGEMQKESEMQKKMQTAATIQTAATKPPSMHQTGRNLSPGSVSQDPSRMSSSQKQDLREQARNDIRMFIRQANASV